MGYTGMTQSSKDYAILRLIRTLSHISPAQIMWRCRYILRRKMRRYPAVPRPATPPHLNDACLTSLCDFLSKWVLIEPPKSNLLKEMMASGALTFMSHTVPCPEGLPWQHKDQPRLWLYHLHYFDYALWAARATVADAGKSAEAQVEYREQVLAWMHDWIESNPPGADIAWDAFTISKRLVNWAFAIAAFEIQDARVLASYQQQTRYLAKSLEHDIRANHLLKNAVALVVAGTLLQDDVLGLGLTLLEQELNEQVLRDGGHYERSPMYHLHVLEDVLVARVVLGKDQSFFDKTLKSMIEFLERILHSDGDIPLFNDAALADATAPRTLLALARKQIAFSFVKTRVGCDALKDAGFYVLGPEDASARMIVKAGASGPDYQLGHAHCDMLSYEFTVGVRRVIVDSGVHGYADSPYRDYCRSTRAHNTVSVNAMEQLEYWSTFRVGRRYTPTIYAWEKTEIGQLLHAGHDGFRPYLHQRKVIFHTGGFWLIVDTVKGPSAISAESYIHFHHDLNLEQQDNLWHIRDNEVDVTIVPFGVSHAVTCQGETDPHQGWYCPEFGKALPAPALTLQATGNSEITFGYAIFPPGISPMNEESISLMLNAKS
jgi:uncharacterized heparinase superfamily protein